MASHSPYHACCSQADLPPPPRHPLPQPGMYQQTLLTAFTLGGMGLHSAEYSECAPAAAAAALGSRCAHMPCRTCQHVCQALRLLPTCSPPHLCERTLHIAHYHTVVTVTVKPACANEGRYFVRVPEGEAAGGAARETCVHARCVIRA